MCSSDLEAFGDEFYSKELGKAYENANAAAAALTAAIDRNKARVAELRNNRGKPGFSTYAIDKDIDYLENDQRPRYIREREFALDREDYDTRLAAAKSRLAAAEKARIDALKSVQPEGSLMRVDTDIQDHELLDWDKPLSEQSELVRNALKDAGKPEWVRRSDGLVYGDFLISKVGNSLSGVSYRLYLKYDNEIGRAHV